MSCIYTNDIYDKNNNVKYTYDICLWVTNGLYNNNPFSVVGCIFTGTDSSSRSIYFIFLFIINLYPTHTLNPPHTYINIWFHRLPVNDG